MFEVIISYYQEVNNKNKFSLKMDNLSKHGILTGILIIIFLSVMTILVGIKIHEITYLTELYKGLF